MFHAKPPSLSSGRKWFQVLNDESHCVQYRVISAWSHDLSRTKNIIKATAVAAPFKRARKFNERTESPRSLSSEVICLKSPVTAPNGHCKGLGSLPQASTHLPA